MKVEFLFIFVGILNGERSFLFIGPGEGSNKPEVLSLPLGDSAICELDIETYPVYVEGGVSFLQNGVITVCGGGDPRCMSLDPFLGIWEEMISPMPYDIMGGSTATLANGDPIILGGCFYPDDDLPSGCSFIFQQETQEWIPGPSLPFDHFYGMCTVQLNVTHSLVLGGYNVELVDGFPEEIPNQFVYLFDGQTFQHVSNMSNPRGDFGCALSSDGNVVVAGGMSEPVEGGDPDGEPVDAVEIYNLQTNTWAQGPRLPEPRGFPPMASDGDKVLLVGGYGEQDYSTYIFSLKPGSLEWEMEDAKLTNGSGGGPTPLRFSAENLNC